MLADDIAISIKLMRSPFISTEILSSPEARAMILVEG